MARILEPSGKFYFDWRDRFHSVVVGNLHWKTSIGTLWKRFSEFGVVSDVFIPTAVERKAQRSGFKFGFVRFRTHAEASRAVNAGSSFFLDNRRIYIKKAYRQQGSDNVEAYATKDRRIATDSGVVTSPNKEKGVPIDISSGSLSDDQLFQKPQVVEGQSMKLLIPDLESNWLNRAAVGVLHKPVDCKAVEGLLNAKGVQVSIAPLSNIQCLLLFLSTEDRDLYILEYKNFFLNHFVDLEPWSAKGGRFLQTWVMLEEVPLQLWDTKFFEKLGAQWGRLVEVAEVTSSKYNLVAAWIRVEVPSLKSIPQVMEGEANGLLFKIYLSVVREELVPKYFRTPASSDYFSDVNSGESPVFDIQNTVNIDEDQGLQMVDRLQAGDIGMDAVGESEFGLQAVEVPGVGGCTCVDATVDGIVPRYSESEAFKIQISKDGDVGSMRDQANDFLNVGESEHMEGQGDDILNIGDCENMVGHTNDISFVDPISREVEDTSFQIVKVGEFGNVVGQANVTSNASECEVMVGQADGNCSRVIEELEGVEGCLALKTPNLFLKSIPDGLNQPAVSTVMFDAPVQSFVRKRKIKRKKQTNSKRSTLRKSKGRKTKSHRRVASELIGDGVALSDSGIESQSEEDHLPVVLQVSDFDSTSTNFLAESAMEKTLMVDLSDYGIVSAPAHSLLPNDRRDGLQSAQNLGGYKGFGGFNKGFLNLGAHHCWNWMRNKRPRQGQKSTYLASQPEAVSRPVSVYSLDSRKEAKKTLAIGKLLGFSFVEDDETVQKALMSIDAE